MDSPSAVNSGPSAESLIQALAEPPAFICSSKVGKGDGLFERVYRLKDPAFWLGISRKPDLGPFLRAIVAPKPAWMTGGQPDLEIQLSAGTETEAEILHQFGFAESRRIRLPNGSALLWVQDAPRHSGVAAWMAKIKEALHHPEVELPLAFTATLRHGRRIGFFPAILFASLTPEQRMFIFEHERLALADFSHDDVVRRQGSHLYDQQIIQIRGRMLTHLAEPQDSQALQRSWKVFMNELSQQGYQLREEKLTKREAMRGGLMPSHASYVLGHHDWVQPDRESVRLFHITFYPRAEKLLSRSERVLAALLMDEPEKVMAARKRAGKLVEAYEDFLRDVQGTLLPFYGDALSQAGLGSIMQLLSNPNKPVRPWDDALRNGIQAWRADFMHILRYAEDRRSTPGITLHVIDRPA